MQRPAPARAIVTLLADYVPHLECAPIGALRNELAIAAGVSTDCIQVRAAALRKVRGFRGIWGLPRPARTALAKGSTFVIDAPTDAGKLADALARGVGARTNEGFGRVAVDWTVHGKRRDGGTVTTRGANAKLMRPKLAAGNLAEIPAVTAIAARRSDRLMQDFVAAVLEGDRAVAAAKALVRVPPSQLGNLRAAVSGSMRGPDICDWFRSICEKTAGERWRRVKVPSLLEGQPARAGHAFVWQSLLGGKVDDHDRLDESAIGSDDVKSLLAALSRSAGGVPDATTDAAQNRASDTVRLIIAGLVSNTARLRSQKVEDES
jgi:CRISPR-associated protein Csx10